MRPAGLFFLCLALLGPGCAAHRVLDETPVRWDVDLAARERVLYEEALTHLLPEGLMVYMKRPPGTLRELYRQGAVQADGAYHNGCFLAALSFKAAVTEDPSVRRLARRVWGAHHLLASASGYEGLVARSFGRRDPSEPGYVFRRDGSGDALIGWTFGTGVYVNLLADGEERRQAASDLRAVARHLLRHDRKIHEKPGLPTPYGDFRTPVAGVPVGHLALAMMAVGSLALRLSPGDEGVRSFFDRLLAEGYPSQAESFYAWFPHHADNTMAYALNLVTALWNDPSEERRRSYRAGAEAFWERTWDWQMAFYALAYAYAGGRKRPESVRDAVARLRNLPAGHHQVRGQERYIRRRMGVVPLERRPMTSSFWSQNVFRELAAPAGLPLDPVARARVDFLLAYWFGRWLGRYGGLSGGRGGR